MAGPLAASIVASVGGGESRGGALNVPIANDTSPMSVANPPIPVSIHCAATVPFRL